MYDIPKFALAFVLNDAKRKIEKNHCKQLKIPQWALPEKNCTWGVEDITFFCDLPPGQSDF